ncbi:hypothetical protein [Thermomonas aquatica]|uniref:Uncharacterized protein n=1 Tax=Thermomonas aquatica TaxID=2202149 RepID=A0A5B7ZR59_9GAMM|nr:hypothetical protein [Thermomonas aquatica]QDA57013.1 hypothetical protein FHQ07_06625 [Thermomonas aquatica]
MKKTLASKIKLSLNDSLSEADSDAFETITLRPNEDVGAMISALNELLRLPVSTLFVDEVSKKLCDLLLESKDNQSIIEEFLDEPLQAGSVLSLLEKKGAIKDESDGEGTAHTFVEE